LARVRIVLVRPESPANVGAAARVVRNTGAGGLALVAPGDWRTVDCWRTAWGAQDVLEEARVFDDLAAAVADAALSVALTGRRAPGPPPGDVRAAAAAVGALGRDEIAALVFGPETTGLTNDEIATCGRAARIPSDSRQPSYNLSHAVAIAAYEVHRATRRAGGTAPRRATHEEKELTLTLLREGLLAMNALPRVQTDRFFREWRALVHRTDLTPKEIRLLQHLARKMARVSGAS
jgi:TrmH family RNA methyltransferase